jgi:hypothetical protein
LFAHKSLVSKSLHAARRALPVTLFAVLAIALASSGCRRYNPPPSDAGVTPNPTGGTGGRNTGGSPATGGGPGTGGRPIDPQPDVAPPDLAPACGKAAQACCPGNRCLEGGCCEDGKCTMHGNSCSLEMSTSCLNSKCSNECGGPGLKCCGGAKRNCTFPLTVCDGPGTGVCVACGGMGQPCCREGYCSNNVVCMANRCGPPPDGGSETAPPVDAPIDTPKG